jgi:hypothetical protein
MNNNSAQLWCSGCSHTYGHGLPDCFVPPLDPGDQASELAWPSILGQVLRMPVHNLSDPGAGVRWVWWQSIQAPVQPGDVQVVFWPEWSGRVDHISGPDVARGDYIKIRYWNPEHEYYFQNYWSSYDQWLSFCALSDQLRRVRHSQGVHFYELVWEPGMYTEFSEPAWYQPGWLSEYFGADLYARMPPALDGRHRGVQAHQLFGQRLAQIIQASGAC